MKPVLPIEHQVGSLPCSYRDLVKDFIDFAITKGGAVHGKSPKYPVYYLGTYWDDPPVPAKESTSVKSPIHLFVNPIIAIVSLEEHKKEFPPAPTDKQVMGRTEEIIDDADAEITIQGNGKTSDYSIGQLQRVQIPYRKRLPLRIGAGVWPGYRDGGDVSACWDGYFIAFEDVKPGKYTINLNADCPFLGQPGHRYISSFEYDLEVI
jgi:hypothetical protein